MYFPFWFPWYNQQPAQATGPNVVSQTLEITRGMAAPDCVQAEHLLINGKFMGPAIQLSARDHLALTVKNQLNTSLSIHIHGLHDSYSCFA